MRIKIPKLPAYRAGRLNRHLMLHEAVREKPYKDSEGIWTWGVGHNLEANG